MPSALFIYFFSAIVARPKLLSDPLQWPGRLTEVKAAARRLAVGRLKRWDPNRITQRTAELCPCLPTAPSACLGCVLNLWGQVNWKMEHLVLPTYKMEIIWICHVSSDKEKKERAARQQPSQLDRLPRHTIHTRHQARSTTTTSVSSWACRGVGLTTHWTSLKCGWEDSWMCVPITWSRHPLLSVCLSLWMCTFISRANPLGTFTWYKWRKTEQQGRPTTTHSSFSSHLSGRRIAPPPHHHYPASCSVWNENKWMRIQCGDRAVTRSSSISSSHGRRRQYGVCRLFFIYLDFHEESGGSCWQKFVDVWTLRFIVANRWQFHYTINYSQTNKEWLIFVLFVKPIFMAQLYQALPLAMGLLTVAEGHGWSAKKWVTGKVRWWWNWFKHCLWWP